MITPMTPDATEQTSRASRNTGSPVEREATPNILSPSVPSPEPSTEHPQRDVVLSDSQNSVPSAGQDELPTPQDGWWGKYRTSRAERREARNARNASRAADAEQARALQNATQVARDTERDRQRAALSRNAAGVRRGVTRVVSRETRAEQLAPIPHRMRVVGVWLDRTIGTTPLLAPLIVSGYFTVHVFTDAPLSVPLLIALMITAALEGGVWKLSRIYEATLLEGDSTLGIRVAIGLYLALISGMIYGHAYYAAWLDAQKDPTGNGVVVVDWSKWAPAAGVAMMSALGVLVWSKQARYLHRVELRAAGQIDPRAPKFATLAWVLHTPETFSALRHSVRYRISSPIDATNDLRLYRAAGRPPIWPIPQGFSWANGTLTLVEPITGRSVPAVGDVPQNMFRGISQDVPQGTEQQGTGRVLSQDALTEQAPRNIPQNTEQAARNIPQNTGNVDNRMPAAGDGTVGVVPRGTPMTEHRQGASQDSRVTDDSYELADVLKYREHLIAVTDACPDWMTVDPTIRKINTVVDEARRARTGIGFNSNQTATKVRDALIKLRDRPALLDLMRLQEETTQ